MEIEYTYNQYVDDILTGRIKSCEAIYLACERYKAFMNRSDMYFDEDDASCTARLKPSNKTQPKEKMTFYFNPKKIHIFDAATEENLF